MKARLALVCVSMVAAGVAFGEGDPQRGARAFQACAACHPLDAGRHMTGPSLAGIWGRKAAGNTGFQRYSEALKRSGIVWGEATLDKWFANPETTVPGNLMAFQGARDARALPDLKKAPPGATVTAIRHCGDRCHVTNGANETRPYWEFNLRFKTDASPSGPVAGKPVLVGQGMQGDRAQVVFSRSAEISAFIRERC